MRGQETKVSAVAGYNESGLRDHLLAPIQSAAAIAGRQRVRRGVLDFSAINAEVDGPFARLKLDEIETLAMPSSAGELVSPAPADAPPMPQAHFALGPSQALWSYRGDAGAVLFAVSRFDKADGTKHAISPTARAP
jgi:hypothetical protein